MSDKSVYGGGSLSPERVEKSALEKFQDAAEPVVCGGVILVSADISTIVQALMSICGSITAVAEIVHGQYKRSNTCRSKS